MDHAEHRVGEDEIPRLVHNLAEARDHATGVMRSLTKTRSLENWRDWVVHVSDDLGDELFVVPFAFVLGKPIEVVMTAVQSSSRHNCQIHDFHSRQGSSRRRICIR